jgi:hypothetical protein
MVDGIIWPEHVKKREVIWHGKKLLIPLWGQSGCNHQPHLLKVHDISAPDIKFLEHEFLGNKLHLNQKIFKESKLQFL